MGCYFDLVCSGVDAFLCLVGKRKLLFLGYCVACGFVFHFGRGNECYNVEI